MAERYSNKNCYSNEWESGEGGRKDAGRWMGCGEGVKACFVYCKIFFNGFVARKDFNESLKNFFGDMLTLVILRPVSFLTT